MKGNNPAVTKLPKMIRTDQDMVFFCQNCSDLLWEKKCSSNHEIFLKFEAEGREFSKFLEQFIQTVKAQNILWKRMLL